MITVHHLETSRSQRVLWLPEELGVPYEIKRYGGQGDVAHLQPAAGTSTGSAASGCITSKAR